MNLKEVVSGVQKTDPLYLFDSYRHSAESELIKLVPDEKQDFYLVTDRTIFHPKGGGQPADEGLLKGSDFAVQVKKVFLVDDKIVHWGKCIEGQPSIGDITMEIDWHKRYLYMRRHTACHLFDHCLEVSMKRPVETLDSWLGEPCYVSYRGDTPSEEVINSAEDLENSLIQNGGSVKMRPVSHQEFVATTQAPNRYRLPKIDVLRVVMIKDFSPIPCGGTHVKDLKEIESFHIKKLERVEPGYRVYYEVEKVESHIA